MVVVVCRAVHGTGAAVLVGAAAAAKSRS
jgi:hypothetical protein